VDDEVLKHDENLLKTIPHFLETLDDHVEEVLVMVHG
jgi:hypothetical protein